MYKKAMMEAGVTDNEKCLFVDDSYCMSSLSRWEINGLVTVLGAKEFGWKEVCHLLFPEDKVPHQMEGIRQLRDLQELREIYPHVFRKVQKVNHTN
jgi:pyrimidine and pyridine-specific 5'-nucleotidase